MVPGDVALNHSQLFLTRTLGARGRVLEVGCGSGQLAWRLAHLGLEVVGLDIALPVDRPTHPALHFEKGDFFQFKADPFDAVIFTSSLHHLNPLKAAVSRARNLLKPGGLLIIEELDLLAPDEPTLRWYYETQGLLAHAGVLPAGHAQPLHNHAPAGRLTGRENENPRTRWQEEHVHAPPLHSGQAMLSALREVGDLAEVTRVPYLYRTINSALGASARDLNVAEWLFATEQRRVEGGSLKGVGLRAVCRAG